VPSDTAASRRYKEYIETIGDAMNFDTTKYYRTRSGDRVTIHNIIPTNALGETVTFPVKVSIRSPHLRARRRFTILTMEGRASVLRETMDDIVGLWDDYDA
jgi:hypothetical protein